MNRLKQERYEKIISIINGKNAIFSIYVEILGLGHKAKSRLGFCGEDEIEIIVYNPTIDYLQQDFSPHRYPLTERKQG